MRIAGTDHPTRHAAAASMCAWRRRRRRCAPRSACVTRCSPRRWARASAAPTLGLDRDRFDPYCDHLIVRAQPSGDVVGTYRILPPDGRRRAGGWYCAAEFDVGRLAALRRPTPSRSAAPASIPPTAAATPSRCCGRACCATSLRRRCRYVIGCASIGTDDGGHIAASVCRRLLQDHLAPADWRVVPRRAFVLEGWREIPDAPLPPLLKGYLRLGAQVCGEPAWDPDFNTADLLMVLPLARINPRYVDRLLRAA